jgi:GT2 family glycosyltransferase
MQNSPRISIIIPNHNGCGYLENCLRSLLAQTHAPMEIVIVDNASSDRSVEVAAALAPQAILLRQKENLGFAGGANAGIRAARGDWVAILNNDTEAAADWLSECARAVQDHPDASFLACKIFDFRDRGLLYSAGDCFLRAGIGYRRGQEQRDRPDLSMECEIFSASGCAALYNVRALREAGGFDERFFAYLEDVDLGLRLQAAGHRGYYVPSAEVYHHGAATSGGEFSPLAVRLRTRNALLLLLKSMPVPMLLRWMPLILFAQAAWLIRAARHGRLVPYIRGLAEAFRLAPAMVRARRSLRRHWRGLLPRLRHRILQSEAMARRDFQPPQAQGASLFLKLYFRLF